MPTHSIHSAVNVGYVYTPPPLRRHLDEATGAYATALALAACIVIYFILRKKHRS